MSKEQVNPPGRLYGVLLGRTAEEEIRGKVAEAENEDFTRNYLPLAVALGGDWTDAEELREAATDEVQFLRTNQLLDALETELDGAESERTSVHDIDGKQYFLTQLSTGWQAMYRVVEATDMVEGAEQLAADADVPTYVVMVLYNGLE